MPWKPRFPGERPTLGFEGIAWLEDNLATPDREDYHPLILTREQAEFLLRFYELDPVTGRRIVRRGVLSRARGWGKSPFVAAICILEALGPVVPDGWDADGRPVGMPWVRVRTPLVQIAAVSEDQVLTNTWSSLLEMLDPRLDPPVLDNYRGLEPLDTMVNLPRGKMLPITAAAATTKGARAVFSAWDQTEEWTLSNGGHRLRRVMADNAAKVGGSYIETPNAFTPGLNSVAEQSAAAAEAQATGRAKLDKRLLYDHREAPPETDLTDYDSLLEGLRHAYGDSSKDPRGCVIHDPPCPPGWADHDDHIGRIWDADADEQESRANFLGQITHATDSWVSAPEWNARKAGQDRNPVPELRTGDTITLGFDGSRGRAKGKPDATALIGCRVSDGHLFQLEVWEADDDKTTWDTWSPPLPAIDAKIADAFKRYKVVAFYADPGRDWRSQVNTWEADYGSKVKVQVSKAHPFEWWMTGGRALKVEAAVEALEGAIRNGDMTHDGSYALTAHVLHARRRLSHGRLALGKSSPASTRKIDAAVAAVLAWQARLDSLAGGHGRPKRKQRIQRVR